MRIKSQGTKPIKIEDVARHAGVSTSTVSRALNGKPSVNRALAKRVFQTVEALRYVPNTEARTLVTGKSRLLGLLVPVPLEPLFTELAYWFADAAWSKGYEVLTCPTGADKQRMRCNLQRLLGRNVEGIAALLFDLEHDLIRELSALEVPVLFLSAPPQVAFARSLELNYLCGMREAIQHLAILGHRRIAFMAGSLETRTSALKCESYIRSIQEIGCTPMIERLVETEISFTGGMEGMQRLLRLSNRPTAVLCGHGVVAFGALRSLTQSGISVPGEMSLISFDDSHPPDCVVPSLTAIQVPRTELANTAVTVLHSLASEPGKRIPNSSCVLRTSLAVRESTSYPAGRVPPQGEGVPSGQLPS